ncbi:MAG: glycerophosphodiester phosphodiesterase family protein [Hyphomicrobiaceae bacterium]
MLDRSIFQRPIAHRGLHAAARGVIENSGPAFEAALAKGYGIECDLQPAADGTAMVFHDTALARLVEAPGGTADHTADDLCRLAYRDDASARILRLSDLLAVVAGRVPLLIEVKSEWTPPDARFLGSIVRELAAYRGPFAVMSFDPAVVAALKPLLPGVPRGIVSGLYDATWWPGKLDADKAYRLSHLLDSRPAEPDFFAYHVKALPTPVTRFVREGLGLPLFTWTVRTAADLAVARKWADAPIFEDVDPTS